MKIEPNSEIGKDKEREQLIGKAGNERKRAKDRNVRGRKRKREKERQNEIKRKENVR